MPETLLHSVSYLKIFTARKVNFPEIPYWSPVRSQKWCQEREKSREKSRERIKIRRKRVRLHKKDTRIEIGTRNQKERRGTN